MKSPDLEVLARPDRLGEHPVGDVADQHVLEGQLALAGQRGSRRPGRGCPSPGATISARSSSRWSLPASGASEPSQNVRPDDGRLLDEAALERVERVEPGRQHGLDGVGQLGRPRRARPRRSGAPSPRRTAGCRRSARRPPGGTVSPAGQQRGHERSRLLGGQRLEHEPAWPSRARRPSSGGGRAARRAPGRPASAARAPTGRGARSRRACRRRPSGCPRTPARAAGGSPSPRCRRAGRRRTTRAAARGPRPVGTSSAGTSRPISRRDQRRLALGLARPSRRPCRRTGRRA